jgi:predicted metalloprotease
VVTKNPLYAVGRIPASKCKEPSARPTSTARVRAYYTQTLACLNKVWAPVVREAGFRFSAPGLVVSAGRPSSSLCRLSDSANYCNGVIYMDASFDIANYKTSDRVWTRTTMAFLIAHEYGHHVQALTGILAASHARETSINGVDAPLQESRRRELQASCLSGVYQGADRTWFPVRGSWLQRWQFTVRNRGDEWNPQRDHGSKKNHGRWSLRGFGSADPGSCNTFTAAPSAVS